MASIIYNNSNARVNPTTNYLPINVNGKFVDSELYRPSDGQLQKNFHGVGLGLKLDFLANQYTLGDFDNVASNTKIIVDDANNTIKISAATVGGTHLPTSTFLKITVNGTPFTLGLLQP
jgi:hypothetical protein